MDQHRLNIPQLERALRGADRDASSDYDLTPALHPRGAASRLRPAAVLIPLVERGGALHVVLTKRARNLKHHPGQIAFPGGKIDPGDASAAAAALREADEEIGLPPAAVTLLGALAPHETVTRFTVTPFVGLIPPAFRPRPRAGEVEEVFDIPLAVLMDPANLQTHSRILAGQERRYFAIPYGPYYVWGATARILKGLSDLLNGAS